MSKTKICMGCFAEMELKHKFCRYCGWGTRRENPVVYGHITGDILEKRYLLGGIYYKTDEYVIRRVYDDVTRITCFLFYQNPEYDAKEGKAARDSISLFSSRLQTLPKEYERKIFLLSVKKLGDKKVLLFAMKEKYLREEQFLKILALDQEENQEELLEKEESSGSDSEQTSMDQTSMEDSSEEVSKSNEEILPEHTILQGHYSIMGCIGIGGFGITYLANDSYTGRCVAIKEYFPAQWAEREDGYVGVKNSKLLPGFQYGMETFLKEIRITGSLLHTEGTLLFQDAFYENDTLYMVMDYIPGLSIAKELKQKEYKPYKPAEVKEIILPVMNSLEEIHDKKLIHSDISPGNIMKDQEGKSVLIDFGAAKYQLDSQPTLMAAFLKTDYAAPEQYKTAKEGIPKDEGPWTDIYSLGATMYYMLTGQKPLDVNTRLSKKKTELPFPKLGRRRVPADWVRLIQKATQLDREKRFQNMREFREEMEKID